MWKLGCLALAVLLAVPPVAVAVVAPAWAVGLTIVVELVLLGLAAPTLVHWGLGRFTRGLFESKSRVLRGAEVQLHQLRDVPRPPTADPPPSTPEHAEGDDSAGDAKFADTEPPFARYVELECTITPRQPPSPGDGAMRHWDPWELRLVPFDADTGSVKAMQELENEEVAGEIHEIHRPAGADAPGEASDTGEVEKQSGPARLVLVFGCPDGLTGRVKLQYYFEAFGDFEMPPAPIDAIATSSPVD